MNTQNSVTLRCEHCRHTWTARNTPGKARQCSMCRSRKIVKVKPENRALLGQEKVSNSEEVLLGLLYVQKKIVYLLNENDMLSEEDFAYLEAYCPWCGEDSMKSENIDENSARLKCRKCGRAVP